MSLAEVVCPLTAFFQADVVCFRGQEKDVTHPKLMAQSTLQTLGNLTGVGVLSQSSVRRTLARCVFSVTVVNNYYHIILTV